jgi:hypothetical protein
MRLLHLAALVALGPLPLTALGAQDLPVPALDQKKGGSDNVKVLSRAENNPGAWKAADIELEQDRDRPYVYVSGFVNFNTKIYDISNPASPKLIYQWRIGDPELHRGIGAMDGKYFKINGRYYYAQSLQFQQGTPDADLGAVILDVTGLPDPSTVKEVARIRYPESPGGFHNTFAYKHSSGRALYFATVNSDKALIYDLDQIVKGTDPAAALVGQVHNPTPLRQLGASGYHDFYVGYDPQTGHDKFYGAGLGGYSVWNVTQPEQPAQLFTITSLGLDLAHTFTPSPDGRYAVTETEYQYSPLRIWDLEPGQSGKTKNIDQPISAWTADLRALSHNHEVRWPYVFVSAYEDGLQIFTMEDPRNPKTVGRFYTCNCTHEKGFGGSPENGWEGTSVMQGAFGVDVRNYDGLVVISDMRTGLWTFKFAGFDGWKGSDHGMPDISSVQDWDRGPARTRPIP